MARINGREWCFLSTCTFFLIFSIFWSNWVELEHFLHEQNGAKVKNKIDNFVSSLSRDRPDPLGPEMDPVEDCRMDTCFNFTRCRHGPPYKHYVYPVDDNVKISFSYKKIINVLKRSPLYTPDPEKACLFILSLDTLNRDKLSETDYVRNMQTRLDNLNLWNNGENHVIFNLYSGTYPDYSEKLDFDTGKAILARASLSNEFARHNFDVSMPLFHSTHPEKGGEEGDVKSNVIPLRKDYFLAFKGKRYVYGIGSETRNSLYHLHNGKDVVLLTTCKHGKSWKENQDERCEKDNALYDKWDYQALLQNATFCLVPRGRRLGSFRFLETLQAGCIPVVLSNDWKLPFDSVIDWTQSVMNLDERMLLQVPDMLKSMSVSKIHSMRQHTQVIWDRYLNSINAIIMTTLEIIHDRIKPHHQKSKHYWNSTPENLFKYFTGQGQLDLERTKRMEKFTMVINAFSETDRNVNNLVSRLLKSVSNANFISKIIVVWASNIQPRQEQFAKIMKSVPVEIAFTTTNSSSHVLKFTLQPGDTEAIVTLNYNIFTSKDKLEFMFSVWKQYTDRLVGLILRSHHWDNQKKRYVYTSRISNEYSMILPEFGSIFSRKYVDKFKEVMHLTEEHPICSDILMNFVISHATKKPPIKILQQKNVKEMGIKRDKNLQELHEIFNTKQNCFDTFVQYFGYLPLKKSQMRLDPVLFKDPVSNTRKKYKQLES